MRKITVALALGALLAPVRVHPEGRVEFKYTIELQKQGEAFSRTTFLPGFDTQDGLRLKVELNQPSYCYLMVGDRGEYRIAFPEPDDRSARVLAAGVWAKLPRTTFVRIGDDPSVGRIYLVVASQRLPELEAAALVGAQRLSEAAALTVRDRSHGGGSYLRDLDGNEVRVRYRPREAKPAVVVEEIALLRR